MIADTDFLLALVKPEDWLKPAAEAVLRRHRQDLRATEANLLELLLVAHRYRLAPLDLVAQVHQLVPFEDENLALMAADNMQVHGLTPFVTEMVYLWV